MNSNQAEEFLKENLTVRLESEVFVILGNTEEDVDWFLAMLHLLKKKSAELLKVRELLDKQEHESRQRRQL